MTTPIDELEGAALTRTVAEALGIGPAPMSFVLARDERKEVEVWSRQGRYVVVGDGDIDYAMNLDIIPDYANDLNAAYALLEDTSYIIKGYRKNYSELTVYLSSGVSQTYGAWGAPQMATEICRAWLKWRAAQG